MDESARPASTLDESSLVDRRIVLPGTLISLMPIEGLVLTPASSSLWSAEGDVVVMVATSTRHVDLEHDNVWMSVFKHKHETFAIQGAQATLYSATRAEDANMGYDSWWLCIHAPEAILTVQVFYTGERQEVFESLEAVARSVRWSSLLVDSEVALGYRLVHPGLNLSSSDTGTLAYTVNQHAEEAELSIYAMPVPLSKLDAVSAGCGTVVGGKAHRSPVRTLEFGGYVGCQAVAALRAESKPEYRALVRTPEGAILVITAATPKTTSALLEATFEQAVRSLTRTRR